jgi:hypothetical protein
LSTEKEGGVFRIDPADQAVRVTAADYLSLGTFASEADRFLLEAHRSLAAGESAGAQVLFRAASIHNPQRLDALVGAIHALPIFETSSEAEAVAICDELAGLLNSFRTALGQSRMNEWLARDAEEWPQGVNDDPRLIVADLLCRVRIGPNQADSWMTPVELPCSSGAWALRELRRLFDPVQTGDGDVSRMLQDLRDGQQATYRLLDVQFALAAKEASLAALVRSNAEFYVRQRERTEGLLAEKLGAAWTAMKAPVRDRLLEAETHFQTQATLRIGDPTLILGGYFLALEAWLKAQLGIPRSERRTLGQIEADLRSLHHIDETRIPPGGSYQSVRDDREFWCIEVPNRLGGGLVKLRNATSHGATSASWEELEYVREQLLGSSLTTGLMQHTA